VAVPTVEPVIERITQHLFESVLAIKNDTGGNYWTAFRKVTRQPTPIGDVKEFHEAAVLDGDLVLESKPGGDLQVAFDNEIWAYARDPHNVSQVRTRLIRDVIVGVHVGRSRDGNAYDSRVVNVEHDKGLLTPVTWIIFTVRTSYRAQASEV
jgi:hypothetical protein